MPTILAPNGRPARRELALTRGSEVSASYSGYGLYNTPRNSGQADYYRPRRYQGARGDVITEGDWLELLDYSRQLYAQLGNLGGAIIQKNLYAVGDAWKPQFYGSDQAWGEAVEEWLKEQFYPMADVRGPAFDFVTNLFLDGLAMDVDGDSLMVLTESERGFPQLKYYPAHRIGGWQSSGEVKDGPYRGAMMRNGVIFNRDGRAIAYRVKGEEGGPDVDISAVNAQFLFEPEWQHQGRGIPRVGRTLLDWFDVQDIDVFLKRGVKLDASQGLLHYTETGTADTAESAISDNDSASEDTDLKIQRREGGEILYMKAGSGEKIESFSSDRPHPNTEAFIARLERRGLLAVGWFYELIDPSKIGGASVRLIQDQARASVAARQKTIRKRAKRAVIYAVAKAMKNRLIPRNDGDWWKWNFETPAQLTVDAGYDRQADVDDLKMGLTTKAAVCAKFGRWHEDVAAQQDREFDALVTRAKAHAEKHGLPLEYVLDRLEQRSPNPAPIAGAAEVQPQKKEEEKP